MRNWRPVDFIVAFLTVMVGTLFIGLLAENFMGEPATIDTPEDLEVQKLSAAIIQSVISIITLYVGAAIQKKADDNNLEP